MAKNHATVKLNFFDFLFTPHKTDESPDASKTILKQCIQRINDERTKKQKAIVINRNAGSKEKDTRNIFVSSAAYLAKEKKYKCRIALIRDGKIPTIVNKTNYSLTSFNSLGDKAIAETTNFYIDMKGNVPIVCCEFNNQGPRISDIEYYFRHISSHHMLRISKSCSASIHMKLPVNEVLNSITDVLKFNIKVHPKRLSHIYKEVGDPYITNMNALANTVKPKMIKVENFFRERGKDKQNHQKNHQAIAFIKRILHAVKKDNKIIEDFDDFHLEFEKSDGSEDFFDLIRGKEEIIIECSYTSTGNYDSKELFNKASIKFDEYLQLRHE